MKRSGIRVRCGLWFGLFRNVAFGGVPNANVFYRVDTRDFSIDVFLDTLNRIAMVISRTPPDPREPMGDTVKPGVGDLKGIKMNKAKRIVRAIIDDLCDRSELQNEWEAIDAEVKAEISLAWIDIVRREIDSANTRVTLCHPGKETMNELNTSDPSIHHLLGYRLVWGLTIEALERKVNTCINAGFEPFCAPVLVEEPNANYLQAMIYKPNASA